MSYIVVGGRGDCRSTCIPGCWSSSNRPPIPGTTEELVQPMLEADRAEGRRSTSSSPSRPSGSIRATRSSTPTTCRRSSAASTPACTRDWRARSTRSAIDTVVPVSSPQVAEMVKLLENTFRAVNIGLVNEIALMCDRLGIDVWEVVDAAATKPFGFMPFYPGPGLGGHCIPIDPFYLSWKAKQTGFEARFIELAGQVNGAMPHFVVDKIADALNTAAQVAERVDGADPRARLQAGHRRHPRVAVARRDDACCSEKGARVAVRRSRTCPTLAARALARRRRPAAARRSTPETLAASDCVAILTDHSASTTRWCAKRATPDRRHAQRHRRRARARVPARRAGTRHMRRRRTTSRSGWRRRCMVTLFWASVALHRLRLRGLPAWLLTAVGRACGRGRCTRATTGGSSRPA